MNCGAVIKQKREEARLTQPALAKKLGITESTLRKYELGLANVPHDVADRASVILKAPEIAFAKCSECPSNWLNVCVLNVDSHPNTEILTIIQEAKEAVEAVQRLELRNGSLSPEQREALERACDQVFDLIPLAATSIASWCRTFGLDMKRLKERHMRKLQARGYLQRGEEAA